jgi:hypothetical protein
MRVECKLLPRAWSKEMNFVWKTKTGQYQTGEILTVNLIRLADYSWNSSLSKDETEENKIAHRYVGNINLPGLITLRIYGATPDGIKSSIENRVTKWFEAVGRGNVTLPYQEAG